MITQASYFAAMLVLLALVGCTAPARWSGTGTAVPPFLREPGSLFPGPFEAKVDYRLGCADVLEVEFSDHPEWDCLVVVDVDGRLPLGQVGRPLVEGLTVSEAQMAIARLARCPPEQVACRLKAARAKQLFLRGPVNEVQRILPYQGSEFVSEFLLRACGSDLYRAELTQVRVVRQNLAVATQASVFVVDAEAIFLRNDYSTDITLEPSDQIIVTEKFRSELQRALPMWLRPLYERLIGWR